jgi:hypothetical protein
MSDIIDRVTERVTQRHSRKGFLGTMGKVAIGATAVLTGGAAALVTVGTAAADCCGISNYCSGGCPSGTNVQTTSYCCPSPGCGSKYSACISCLYCLSIGPPPSGCTTKCQYSYLTNTSCPCKPTHSTG